ncbi:MAG TPA: hypothetical protein VFR58_16655 [Flavisolibacter sp.]|nr:hypothetical protein [Flavisolibacter sp.]
MKNTTTGLLPILLLPALFSCGAAGEPYLKHELKAQKIAPACNGKTGDSFSMVSNTIGERYQFSQCMTEGSEKSSTVERKGDTVIVSFDKSGKLALYDITLDINTYPNYNTLIIDGAEFKVLSGKN